MLRIGGYINILISFGHIVGLLWANTMFEATGIRKEMDELAKVHYSLPYLLTIVVAVVFLIFGIYGLSADNRFRKLPFLKMIIFSIAGIYITRSGEELIADKIQATNTYAETIFSLCALAIGLLFLIGGLKKWYLQSLK